MKALWCDYFGVNDYFGVIMKNDYFGNFKIVNINKVSIRHTDKIFLFKFCFKNNNQLHVNKLQHQFNASQFDF